MNRHELRSLSLSSLVVLEAIAKERSVTVVAEKMGMAQPSVSSILSRLRIVLDDPLFIRVGRSLEPTSKVLLILEELSPALDSLTDALSNVREFVPEDSEKTFRIGVSDDVEFSLLPPLLTAMHVAAPLVRFTIEHADDFRLASLLRNEIVSVAICRAKNFPRNSRQLNLRSSTFKVVGDSSLNQEMSLQEFCRRPHIVVSHTSRMRDEIDDALDAIGKRRQVLISVPRYSALPGILSGTDLIATIPDYAAESMTKLFRLRSDNVPFAIGKGGLSMTWLDSQNRDPAEKWMRGMIISNIGSPRVPRGVNRTLSNSER